MKPIFYRCRHCGNITVKVIDQGVPLECCGDTMEELIPHTADKGLEKHVPVVTRVDDRTLRVRVGSEEHPMLPQHYIQFVCLETDRGYEIAYLKPGDKPMVDFCSDRGVPLAVYEYCNVHGLWKRSIK